MKRLTLAAGTADDGERIDRFIAARGGISRGEARRVLERGGVFLNGKRCKVSGRILRTGNRVTVNLEEAGRGADAPRRSTATDCSSPTTTSSWSTSPPASPPSPP